MLIRACRAPSHRPAAIWASCSLVRPLRRDVVDQRQRLRADAEQIVDVYRHAVDADRVVAAHHLGDQHLGPYVVGGDRQTPAVGQVDHVGEIAKGSSGRPNPLR